MAVRRRGRAGAQTGVVAASSPAEVESRSRTRPALSATDPARRRQRVMIRRAQGTSRRVLACSSAALGRATRSEPAGHIRPSSPAAADARRSALGLVPAHVRVLGHGGLGLPLLALGARGVGVGLRLLQRRLVLGPVAGDGGRLLLEALDELVRPSRRVRQLPLDRRRLEVSVARLLGRERLLLLFELLGEVARLPLLCVLRVSRPQAGSEARVRPRICPDEGCAAPLTKRPRSPSSCCSNCSLLAFSRRASARARAT